MQLQPLVRFESVVHFVCIENYVILHRQMLNGLNNVLNVFFFIFHFSVTFLTLFIFLRRFYISVVRKHVLRTLTMRRQQPCCGAVNVASSISYWLNFDIWRNRQSHSHTVAAAISRRVVAPLINQHGHSSNVDDVGGNCALKFRHRLLPKTMLWALSLSNLYVPRATWTIFEDVAGRINQTLPLAGAPAETATTPAVRFRSM